MVTADLNGKTVLVTGGSSGIGLAAVELFARCGAKVALDQRIVKPEDVANAILFLAVHPAVSGQTLAVDCGRIQPVRLMDTGFGSCPDGVECVPAGAAPGDGRHAVAR